MMGQGKKEQSEIEERWGQEKQREQIQKGKIRKNINPESEKKEG